MSEQKTNVEKEVLLPGKHKITKEGVYWNNQISGRPKIVTQIDIPEAVKGHRRRIAIVVSSGILYSRTNPFVQRLREMFLDNGYFVATFDYSGLGEHGGESTGPIEAHSLGQMAKDLETSISTLNEITRGQVDGIVLVGPSAGGNVVATLLNSKEFDAHSNQIKSAILIGTPDDFLDFRSVFEPKTVWGEGGRGFYTSSSGSNKILSTKLWEDSAVNNMNQTQTDFIQIPILVVGGSSDTFCSESKLTQSNNNQLSQRLILEGADHNFIGKDVELKRVIDNYINSLDL